MPRYTPWTWSPPHNRHYSYLLADDGRVLDTIWAGPTASSSTPAEPAPTEQSVNSLPPNPGRSQVTQPSVVHLLVYTVLGIALVLTGSSTPHIAASSQGQPSATTVSSKYQLVSAAAGPSDTRRLDSATARQNVQVQEEEEDYEQDDSDDCDADNAVDDDVEDDATGSGKGKGKRVDSAYVAPQQLTQSMQTLSLGAPNASPSSHNSLPYQQHGRTQKSQYSTYSYSATTAQQVSQPQSTNKIVAKSPTQSPGTPTSRLTVASLDPDVQEQIGYLDRRLIQTDPDTNDRESLDKRECITLPAVTDCLPFQAIVGSPSHTIPGSL